MTEPTPAAPDQPTGATTAPGQLTGATTAPGQPTAAAAPAALPAPTPAPPTRRRRRAPRAVRIALTSLVSILLVLTLASGGLVFWSVRRAYPDLDGSLTLPGLSAPVKVYRDSYGIPQVYARTATDLFRAQGYVHAQDRFWEMDFRRHLVAGRLAEMLGASQVATDAFVRTLGWRRIAERELPLLSDETRSYLDAYAMGVNAWIDQHGGSAASGDKGLEYSILRLTNRSYTVEPWTPIDSLAWLKATAWDLRDNLAPEVDRGLLLASGLGREQVEEFYPATPAPVATPAAAPPLPDGLAATQSGASQTLSGFGALVANMPDGPDLLVEAGAGVGSSSWVVSGALSDTGAPLLANDAHMSPSIPGVWYQIGLHCPGEFNAAGFSLAGFPGVLVGHNDRIAWGTTILRADVTDLYLERIDGDWYRDGTGWALMTTRTEVIRVAGAEPVSVKVRETPHGPLLSDRSADLHAMAVRPALGEYGEPLSRVDPRPLVPDSEPALDPAAPGVPDRALESPYGVALSWTALTPGRTAEAIFAIDRATDWDSFRAATALFEGPPQNLTYADLDGNIGYQAQGRIPVRGRGDGRWISPGWDRSYDWDGYLPFAALPYAVNPPEGYVVTADNAVVSDGSRYALTGNWGYGHRSQRLRDLIDAQLAAGKKVSADYIRQMQSDTWNAFAPELVPYLLDVGVDPSSPVAAARDLLVGWDFTQPAEQPAPAAAAAAFYNATWRHLMMLTFDELGGRVPDGSDRCYEVMRPLLADPGSPWWDSASTPESERRDEILARAMSDALAELRKRLGDDPDAWRWGDLHTLRLTNFALGRSGIAPVRWLLDRGPYPVAGGSDAVNATFWPAGNGYEATRVPVTRMIVDLSNLDDSRWVQLTGDSGHAFHDNYDDQFALWQAESDLPMRWDRTTIEAESPQTLTLRS